MTGICRQKQAAGFPTCYMQTCDTSNAPNDEGQHRRNKKPCTQYWQLYLVFRPCRREEEGLAQRRCAACLALCILRSPTSTNKPVVAPLRMPKAEASNPLQKFHKEHNLHQVPLPLCRLKNSSGMSIRACGPRHPAGHPDPLPASCEPRAEPGRPLGLSQPFLSPSSSTSTRTLCNGWRPARAPEVQQRVAVSDAPSSISLQTRSSRRPGVAAITHAWPSRQQPTSKNSQHSTLMQHR